MSEWDEDEWDREEEEAPETEIPAEIEDMVHDLLGGVKELQRAWREDDLGRFKMTVSELETAISSIKDTIET